VLVFGPAGRVLSNGFRLLLPLFPATGRSPSSDYLPAWYGAEHDDDVQRYYLFAGAGGCRYVALGVRAAGAWKNRQT
jgi:hypothetical protein